MFSEARYTTHYFMSNDQRQFRIGQFAIDNVQIGSADGAGEHFELDLVIPGFRLGSIVKDERIARLIEDHRAHAVILTHAQRCVAGQ